MSGPLQLSIATVPTLDDTFMVVERHSDGRWVPIGTAHHAGNRWALSVGRDHKPFRSWSEILAYAGRHLAELRTPMPVHVMDYAASGRVLTEQELHG